MKLMVVSALKTGNTWLVHLLSAIYGLPEVEMPSIFDPGVIHEAGLCWVGMQHYSPLPELRIWSKWQNFRFITPIRHPGDVLVSLWHMMRKGSSQPFDGFDPARLLLEDGGQPGEHTIHYLKKYFFFLLYTMLDWANSGDSLLVRYEDLWRDPVTTLQDLTHHIQPVSRERIENAVDVCDLSMLRRLYQDPQGRFFRRGGPGAWREELPESILDVFRQFEPYPSLFRALGYTLQHDDPLIDAPAKARGTLHPFLKKTALDNGVPVSPWVAKLYLTSDQALKAGWKGDGAMASDDGFFAWLNAPMDKGFGQPTAQPCITNLAYYIYTLRPDIRARLPDMLGADRAGYAHWFVGHAQADCELDPAFIAPMRASLMAWGRRPALADPSWLNGQPIITNFAAYVYRSRPELQAIFTDVFGRERVHFVRWFVEQAPTDYARDHDPIGFELACESAQVMQPTLPPTLMLGRLAFKLSLFLKTARLRSLNA